MPVFGFIGSIQIMAGPTVPTGWAKCNGGLLNIAQSPALFSVLGTTYGGDGVKTFALPNLQGCVPIGVDDSSGYNLGKSGGYDEVTLTVAQLPNHNHAFNATNQAGTTGDPSGNYLANVSSGNRAYGPPTDLLANVTNAVTPVGPAEPQPHSNAQPSLVLNYMICLSGEI